MPGRRTIEVSDERVDKAWAMLSDIVLGEPVHGETLSRELRVAIQGLIYNIVKMGPTYEARFIVSECEFVVSLLKTMVDRTAQIAADHDEAIIRHAQHARWRNLYRLTKKSGQAKGKAGDR